MFSQNHCATELKYQPYIWRNGKKVTNHAFTYLKENLRSEEICTCVVTFRKDRQTRKDADMYSTDDWDGKKGVIWERKMKSFSMVFG